MSKYEFRLPDIGEGVSEGEIVNWLVREGDSVTEHQDMVEVMTDKATVTIGAPKTGQVAELRAKVGDTVPVGGVLIVLDLGGAEAVAVPSSTVSTPEVFTPKGTEADKAKEVSILGDFDDENLPGMKSLLGNKPGLQSPISPPAEGYFEENPLASPATRKLARELGVDLRRVKPSGTAGRVTSEDLEAHARHLQAVPPAAHSAASQPAVSPSSTVAPVALSRSGESREEERIPIRGLRKRIYENMARSKHTAAQFAYIDECEVTELKALRDRVRPHAERHNVKLSFLPFIVKAVVVALKRHRQFNSWVDDTRLELVLRSTYDIGIAVSTESGLIVPVVRNADRRSIIEIAQEIDRLASQARAGKITREDLGGSSFTITSLGKLGGLVAPPIINYPEVGILGVHEIKRRPVIKGDQIAIGEVMLLSLCSDHRLIDGELAARFAQEIIGLLQEPEALLVEA